MSGSLELGAEGVVPAGACVGVFARDGVGPAGVALDRPAPVRAPT
jgi:hypothetical protein